ncbi:MAG: methyltransferase domain-containing protein [Burkholderiaceae bacterium]|nr:methyltransferase domain-containing protein [Burkholderiaceae bacterium]
MSNSSDSPFPPPSEAPIETPVPDMDPVAVARWAAHTRRQSAWLHDEVGRRMAERLGWMRQLPAAWLDWEPVHGGLQGHHAVAKALPDSKVFIASSLDSKALFAINESSPRRATVWQRLRGMVPQVARPDTQVDLVWANMGLHAVHQPLGLLRQWHRHLNTDGFVMFSCLGPHSLQELRAVYARMGWAPPGHAFTDMHDWGDMLVHEGFAEPVMDAETITLTYTSVAQLRADLRALGRNLHAQRAPLTRGRRWLQHWEEAMSRHWPRTPDGRLALTFEVLYGHAFKPRPRVQVAATSAVSLDDMRRMLRTSPPR